MGKLADDIAASNRKSENEVGSSKEEAKSGHRKVGENNFKAVLKELEESVSEEEDEKDDSAFFKEVDGQRELKIGSRVPAKTFSYDKER